eukprot:2472716-Prymnesium_polylepis.1
MPSDATLICVEVVVQFADQRRRGVHQTRQLRTQPGGVRVVLEVDDGAATSRNVGGLVEVAHAVVVPCVLVYHTAVGERGRVLRHRTQLGEDGLAIAEQNTNATLHHQDRRLGSGEARPIEEWVQRDELGCGTELARDEVQLSDAEAVGGRGADHLHPVLVFGAVAKRCGGSPGGAMPVVSSTAVSGAGATVSTGAGADSDASDSAPLPMQLRSKAT